MRSSRSPLAPVQPDDPPMGWCEKHSRKYNPYKSGGRCPECKRD